ncbi:hypothetical protein GIB67_036820 [Kingdonia uniflora]|uniref:Uncharacterized protein n=1 Tax=Kingdonia uniflora TaxID=39325 RepID=A0A7J7LWR3_9MAGN|nr:hypothetical protein GIB67_036820 [Kingdonia uniflora]
MSIQTQQIFYYSSVYLHSPHEFMFLVPGRSGYEPLIPTYGKCFPVKLWPPLHLGGERMKCPFT